MSLRMHHDDRLLFVSLLFLFSMASGLRAGPQSPAQFEVGTKVSVPADRMMPIGFMSFCEPTGALKIQNNTIFDFAGNEPGFHHAFGLAKETVESGKRVRLDGGMLNRTANYYNGCWARIYRIVNKQGQSLPPSTKQSTDGSYYLDLKDADRVVFVGRRQILPQNGYVIESKSKPFVSAFHFADGPEIKLWDGVFIEKVADASPLTDTQDGGEHVFVKDVGEKSDWSPLDKTDAETLRIDIVSHSGKLPEGVDFGKGCLRVAMTNGEHGIKQTLFAGIDDNWYGQLYPGQKYRLEVWMKQTGLADGGTIRFGMAGKMYPDVKTEFTVTGEWKKYTYDFIGPEFPGKKEQPDGPAFRATGPGTLWMDNARIFAWYEPADLEKPFVPVRQLVEEMRNSQPATGVKGFIRGWAAQPSRSMDSILSYYTSGYPTVPVMKFMKEETIPVHLAYCEATGMNPWITVNVFYTEEDWLALFEYLAAPYDPAKDTPKSKPWAYRRTQHRGNNTPWVDTFDKILFELGNENWHNRANPEWVGFGRAGWVHSEGLQYGLFGKYMFSTVTEQSPWWKTTGLEKKVIFNLGGNYSAALDNNGNPSGYGPDSMRGGWPISKMSSMALYVGPKWEMKEISESSASDEVYQKTLLAYQMGMRENVLNTAKARGKMKELGFDYDLVSYEGGPAGYGGGTTKPTPEEKNTVLALGHSLAMGLTAMDCWLDAYRYGWVAHCLYASKQGDAWSNHTMMGNGFRPTPAWQAMTLSNHELRGDMMDVKDKNVPTLTRQVLDKKGIPTKDGKTMDYPLVRCYPFQQGDRWAVTLLSLKMPGQHDGMDFGNGSTPCSIALPFQKAAKISLVKLQGNPRDTNDQELKVKPERIELPASVLQGGVLTVNTASGSTLDGLPCGSMYVYVFEGVK
ncbi:MAG: hypothetical protein HOO88_05325 [Kiritimatiellaceae bacterium]|nr:hypothetical protein [Kiritimatiellaceae bacterium]